MLTSNDKKYKLKRNHLNELEYTIDFNNNVYLTGLKFYENHPQKKKKFVINQDLTRRKNIFLTKQKIVEVKRDYRNQGPQDLFSLIPEFSQNEEQGNREEETNYQQESSIISENENDDVYLQKIFNSVKTKTKFPHLNFMNSSRNEKNQKKVKLTNQPTNTSKCEQYSRILKSNGNIIIKPYFKRRSRSFTNEKDEFKNLSIFENCQKLGQKVKILREAKRKGKKMDLINLFSYQKSLWNHHQINNSNSTKNIRPRKNRIKPPLPNFHFFTREHSQKNLVNERTAINKEINLEELEEEVDNNQKNHQQRLKDLKIKEKKGREMNQKEALDKLFQIAKKTSEYADNCKKYGNYSSKFLQENIDDNNSY